MKLGLLLESEEGLDWERWRTTYTAAERLGFESIWLSDHLASPWTPAQSGLDPWLALALAAADTRRLRLGTLVSPVTFRPPAIVARMAESLAVLSQGRFVLGLGLGWNADEHQSFNLSFPALGDRVRLLDETVSRVRGLTGERHVPVLIGGSGPTSTLPLVARVADEWNLTTASVELYQQRRAQLAALCAAAGRATGAIRHSVATGVLVGHDAADLRQRFARLQRLVPPLREARECSPGAHGREVGETRPCVSVARQIGWVAGTPPEIVGQLRPLAEAGVELAMLGHYDLDDPAALELLAREVMPALA